LLICPEFLPILGQESKLRQTTQQLNQTKEEFQQYKQRAHALLQEKNLDTNTTISAITDAKTSDLQTQIKKLQGELRLVIKKNDVVIWAMERVLVILQDYCVFHRSYDPWTT